MKWAPFFSLLFTTLVVTAGLAHVLELPHKMGMPAQEYLTVQKIYRGWALLGIAVFGALAMLLVLAIQLRHGSGFGLALIALLCIVAAQIIFWVFTFPVNQQTQNWTLLPTNWTQLRLQWEYSHAAGALFDVASLISLFLLAIRDKAVLLCPNGR